MEMCPIVLFPHGGSQNHGCEAIVRATKLITNREIVLFSSQPEQDYAYGLDKILKICPQGFLKQTDPFLWAFSTLLKRIGLLHYAQKYFFYVCKQKDRLCLSIGGDNYCGQEMVKSFHHVNQQLLKNNCMLVLWSCSIEPDMINDELATDLKQFSLITTRESITYEALISKGIDENVYLLPDVAFVLPKIELELPENFLVNNTVGINISPLVIQSATNGELVFLNYVCLIEYILNHTNMHVALIPHVTWKGNNDLEPLTKLYHRFKDSGKVCLIGDHNCMEQKGFIARCRFFIGARTHATIAAYSSCVPTLAMGYSVKAKGIAKDLFGTWDNYVLSVQGIRNEIELCNAFCWMQKNEHQIRMHLQKIMPDYIKKTWTAKTFLNEATRK